MIILGLDPGTETTGYGLVEVKQKKLKLLKYGWISTKNGVDTGLRLQSIFEQTKEVLKEHQPNVVAIEKLFFFANAKTAMKVSESIGILKLAVSIKKIPLFEYAPLRIKAIVAGNGRAKKEAMKQVIRKFFKIRTPKGKKSHFDDAADALCVALCHAKIDLGIELTTKGGEINDAKR